MLVHAGWARGPPTSRASGGLPLPTGAAFPSPGRVVTSGSLQAGSRCAVERRTGMRLWGRTLPSSGRCQLAPRLRGLCRAEALLLAGTARTSEQTLLTSAGDEASGRAGSLGVSFHQGRVQRADSTHTPFPRGTQNLRSPAWVTGLENISRVRSAGCGMCLRRRAGRSETCL